MPSNGIPMSRMQELLAKVRAARNSETSSLPQLENSIRENAPEIIDFSGTGISNDSIHGPNSTPEGEEAAVEFLKEVTNSIQSLEPKKTGVAAAVQLNEEQELFASKVSSGEDCCFIGAAGTGKTTATGQAIRRLIDSGNIGPVGNATKYLQATSPGILVCSYTRKAVNNIRRAVPHELVPHTLTLHKVLEFAPEFYEIERDDKVVKTMQFVPKRNAQNPLPDGLKLAIFEESSMIGTDLYNLWKAATPHLPQEVFIGDIQQLPPIFGPAILGFKMALLDIIELKQVYRQALQSPIIRLAHAILSGDPYKFDKTVKIREEVHPELGGAKKARKYVPALEQFDEDSEHGILKFQIWQKNQEAEIACYAVVQQFIAWSKKGYYNASKDIILCPFNKSFGTVAINKGLLEYFGRQRQAMVHEIIAGFNKHYYAEGDRVLYDKEDATIISIKRNTSYLGKSPQSASINLDRSGSYSKELTTEEAQAAANDEAALISDILDDDFLNDFSSEGDDGEGRVNVASHTVTIRFNYSEEEIELRTASEVNNLLGGHALTVHKFQGSEEESVFLVLHKSHAMMVQRELLYTAVTRARRKLHIICENDTFFNGVKSQKVKGTTLQDKITTFQGKTSFEDMKQEMDMLKFQKKLREEKRKREIHGDAMQYVKEQGYEPPTSPTPVPEKKLTIAERLALARQKQSA